MREALVVCGGLPADGAGRRQVIELDVSPTASAGRRIDFDTAKLCRPLLDDLPDVLADALEIAAYVHCADRLITRPGAGDTRSIGPEWQRQLRFRIPVRCPDIWMRPMVKSALVEVLTFLSGDRFVFEFTASVQPIALEPYLGFGDRNAQTIRPDQVMLFSGGLDSLAGVARDVIGAGRRAVLVTHQSAKAITSLQDQLADEIAARTRPRQVLYLPVRLNRGSAQPKEHSQRLRSFLFATLGIAYGRMFELNTVTFFENGITSFNLPVAEHVIGTRASRTTHPQVLALYGKLFSLLLDEPVSFVNPFLWETKADIVRTVIAHGLGDLIRLTTSCAAVRNYSMTGLQCGVCSQCVERRAAMIAAGAEDLEAKYATDIFAGPVKEQKALTMVGGHLLRARRLATMSRQAFLSNHGQVFRALQVLGLNSHACAERTYSLHQRYGKEFIGVVEGQLARHATIDGMRMIHPQSMLGMLQNKPTDERPFTDPVEDEPLDAVKRSAKSIKPDPHIITIAIDQIKKKLKIANGPVLSGKGYLLLSKLIAEAEQQSLRPAEDQEYFTAKNLAAHLGVSQTVLRQLVRRLRRKLEREYEAATGYRLDPNDVIQNRVWLGYRLNPYVVVIPHDRMAALPQMSRVQTRSVTTQTAPV